MKYLFYALRPKQWIKNGFIFLPLIFGKKIFDFPTNINIAIAFCLFSLAASVVYLINDSIDYKQDRVHPTKRLRAIASGKVSLRKAISTALVLGIISIVLSFKLNICFGYVVVSYVLFNFIYSKILKDIVIVDVFCIGVFFLLRVIAGGVVAGVLVSHWIIIMTMLLALFLGINKRRQEIKVLERKAFEHRRVLKKYSPYFIDQMTGIIASSILVVYMLYSVDARTVKEFGNNHLMYSIPFVYYGVFRYLYLIHKIRKEGDPTRILLSDKMLQLNILFWVGTCVGVIYFGL